MLKILGLITCFAVGLTIVLAEDEPTYSAAVYEMNSQVTGDSPQLRIAARIEKIVKEIEDPTNKDLDIIVFPEYALQEAQPQPIPPALDKVVLCDNATYNDNIFQKISCAAKSANTYVVINALTQHDCKAEQLITQDTRPCATTNQNVYNTNIVFDRSGAVISTYRKFNIYNENVNSTLIPDVSVFDTDFGVKFGHLTCFDIMFEEPAANLFKLEVKNFVYPTQWYSELPFLTAIQVQQNWAHENNVNLLAAGISNPNVGSTGSGIYGGNQGALKYRISGTNGDLLLKSAITKVPGKNAMSDPTPLPTKMPDIKLLRDQLDTYTHVKLNVTEESRKVQLCHTPTFCCDFQFKLTDAGETANTKSYEYVAAIYNGTRTFGGMPDLRNVVSCAIFTCPNASDITSCGHIIPGPTTIANQYQFTELEISGQFRHSRSMITPNTLAISLEPLPVSRFQYEASKPFAMGEYEYRNISIKLSTFEDHLLTFGIWGHTSSGHKSSSVCLVVLFAVFVSVILYK